MAHNHAKCFLCLEIQEPVGDCLDILTKLVLTLTFIDGLLIMDKILEKGAKEVNAHEFHRSPLGRKNWQGISFNKHKLKEGDLSGGSHPFPI